RCSNTLVTLQDDEIAFALRITEEELAETKALFIRKGFVTDEWEIANWDKRQYVSDSSAARVARHREKKKAESNADVTLQKQPSNAQETEADTDTEAEKNKEKEEKKPSASPRTRKPSKTPLPADFEVSTDVRQWAASKGFDRVDEHFESFVRKAKANGYTYA